MKLFSAALVAGAVASRTSCAFAPSRQSRPIVISSPHRSLVKLHATSPYERFGRMREGWWEQMYSLLERFYDREGHSNVPFNYWCCLEHRPGKAHVNDTINLGKWLRKQREAKNAGTLSKLKLSRLDQLGVDWNANPALRDAYTITVSPELKFLCASYVQWKRSLSSFSQSSARSIDIWVATQEKDNILVKPTQQTRARKLDRRKVRWDVIREGWIPENGAPVRGTWGQMYALLMQFKEREGHCNVPEDHEEDGVELGSWLVQQRRAKMRDVLVPHWQRRLDELGVGW